MEVTVRDFRRAVSYVYKNGVSVDYFAQLSDEDFLKLDLSKELQMGNIRVHNVIVELERIHNIWLPLELYQLVPNNTVGAFMSAVNQCLTSKNNF